MEASTYPLIATTFANSNDVNQDLYGRNILFTAPAIATISEEQIMSRLGVPQTGPITRRDGRCCEPSMPSYLVRPASTRGSDTEIKIVDLGNGSAELG
jgi:serine/threonine-protein kinase SRPK3